MNFNSFSFFKNVFWALVISVFLLMGCVANHFTGEGDHKRALEKTGDVPENVPVQMEFKGPPEACKKAIRQILQKNGSEIASISNEFIKTEKTLLRSASFSESVFKAAGQSFYVLEISLSRTFKGTMVEVSPAIYQKGSINLEERVDWPVVSDGLRHKFFADLSEKISPVK